MRYPEFRTHSGLLAAAITLLAMPLSSWGETLQQKASGYVSDVYAGTDNWLCHPDLPHYRDACRKTLDTLVVEADGSSVVESFQPNENAGVDCFYVYPTTSLDLGANSTLNPGPQEEDTTWQQVGRYAEACRVFAPVYRQRTLTYLALNMVAGSLTKDATNEEAQRIAYGDVLDSFRSYLTQHNDGRGFILVGHSQGSRLLTRLIAEEIETAPDLAERMIAAHIPGYAVAVPKGKDVGGDLASTPACRTPDQTGCVISYASYRKGDPQREQARFGVTSDPATEALCTNPAALAGGPATLHSYLPFKAPPAYETLMYSRGTGGPYANRWTNLFISKRATPFFAVPGQIEGECLVDTNGVSYLEVTIHADPADPRADDYPGEFFAGTGWGLHLTDMNIVQGDLVRLARSQSEAWLNGQ